MTEPQVSVPPHVQVIQMAIGAWVSRVVFTAANLGLADHLADGPKSAAELAGPTGTTPRTLHRFLRAAGNFGWPFFIADNKPYAKIDFLARQPWRDQVEAYERARKAATK